MLPGGVLVFRLEGIMPPMLTPFDDREEIDEEALRSEVRYLLEVGVHGLVVCGSTGEGYSMTPAEVGRVTEIVRDEAGKDVPLITGVIANSANVAIALGLAAKAAGADGLMVTPVHYVFKPTDEGNIDYYRRIADAVGLPIVIYNVIPWNTISVELAVRLVDEVDSIKGIKQSGGDIHGLADVIKALGHRIPIMSALDDVLLASFILGARGAIAAICTIAPELCLDLWEAAKDGDLKRGVELHRRLLPIWRAVGRGDMPARAKEALRMLGRKAGRARSPLIPVDEEARQEIEAALKEAGLL
ncbi:dihydrodipicolinate synthase family protein [Candidatus Bathyarchaeota archaeon]|nr:MAG: dihydrodipicolinate synthase family protein [Candidatus Bathyarchaeota archaeon]